MPNYRRVFVPGGTWFFTVNLFDRRERLLTENIYALRHAIFDAKRKRPFRIDAMVVLPDHLHAIWTLPDGDADYPGRWRAIKIAFSKSLPNSEWRTPVQRARNERGIWQRRYWEHFIRDDDDFRRHVDYCYWNPVKHGHVENVRDWPHSTYHRDVRCGRYARDFELPVKFDGAFGERG